MILQGDCLDSLKSLDDKSVHMCITSPPYYNLRDYGIDGQIGLESTHEEYIDKLVNVFREVKRVLRDDGTFWLNIGDTYAANRSYQVSDSKHKSHDFGKSNASKVPIGLKRKDLIGIPWRLAFALQHDGWWLRQDIIWNKTNCLPESVTDRCVKSHEYIFLFSKSEKYFFDHYAIQEDAVTKPKSRNRNKEGYNENNKRNKRSVWSIPTKPFKGAHFAVFPSTLIEPCILAGTSEKGCCSLCGAPLKRYIDSKKQTCNCKNTLFVPCTVLDPFAGSGTTGVVARKLKRKFILCELNGKYIEIINERLQNEI